MNHEKAFNFILNHARPVDKEMFLLMMKHGDKDKFINELVKYQNDDGGFGHALEPDNYNPNSNPIATNDALLMLYKTNTLDNTIPLVNKMISYLQSKNSYDNLLHRWLCCIESNINYPHAIWWEKKGNGVSFFNPSISLASFLVCYEDCEETRSIIRDGFEYIQEIKEISADDLKCFMLSYCLLKKYNKINIIDLTEYKRRIISNIERNICNDISKYGKEYVSLPSDFLFKTFNEFYTIEMKPYVKAEQNILSQLQQEDGGFNICWIWYNDYKEFEEAKKWWRPRVTMDKLVLDLLEK